MKVDPITAFANAVSEVSKTIGEIIATKRVRHLEAAKDAARRYIHINERFGENENLTDKERKNLLNKFRKKFFKFN